MFSIKNLTISLVSSGKRVVTHCTFSVQPGQIMALTGANGSGKSSLLNALMGHPAYVITEGEICLEGESLGLLSPYQKACKGMFLASQHPIAVPGLRVETLLKESYRTIHGELPALEHWQSILYEACDAVGLPHEVLDRNVGVEFSGGQQKRLEMLQALVLKPKLLLLDELDSGLDPQGVAQISRALLAYRLKNPEVIMIIVSHHNALLKDLVPDLVGIMDQGMLTLDVQKSQTTPPTGPVMVRYKIPNGISLTTNGEKPLALSNFAEQNCIEGSDEKTNLRGTN